MGSDKGGKISFVLLAVAMAGYFLSGLYSLESGRNALILRFGKVVREVSASGIHYHFPAPVEKAVKVMVSEVKTINIQEREELRLLRLTGDENLIVVRALISYDVKNLKDYFFNVRNAESVIKSVGHMCLSEQLAVMEVDDVMTTGKSSLRLVIKNQVQTILDSLQTGIRLISVELTEISPPPNVSKAFNEVSDARVKKQEIIKGADGYANAVIPKARGKAGKVMADAEAYAEEKLNAAKGRAASFNSLLAEYRRNPGVTMRLKYLETVKKVLGRCRVSTDPDPSRSIYYIQKPGKGPVRTAER